VLTFGKHFGKPLSEVTAEYKEWLVFHKFHLRRPDLYQALDEDGYFHPKPKPTTATKQEIDDVQPSSQTAKRHREEDEDSCSKVARLSHLSDVKKGEIHDANALDEVSAWCRSTSDDIGRWGEEEDLFNGLFGKDGNDLNVDEVQEQTFDSVLMLEDGADGASFTEDCSDTDEESQHAAATPNEEEETSRAETPSEPESARELGEEGSKVNEGLELQAMLVDAFQAFERGECRLALRLLRSSIHKVIKLEGALTEEERRCMQGTLVTVVHAARMIACKFRDEGNKHLIDKGDHYRHAGLFEGAVLMYAEAVDLSA